MTTLTVETLTKLIAQIEARRTEESTANSVATTSSDIEHDEFVNNPSLEANFTADELLKKRKKKDSATKAQQTFCVSVFNVFLALDLLL